MGRILKMKNKTYITKENGMFKAVRRDFNGNELASFQISKKEIKKINKKGENLIIQLYLPSIMAVKKFIERGFYK